VSIAEVDKWHYMKKNKKYLKIIHFFLKIKNKNKIEKKKKKKRCGTPLATMRLTRGRSLIFGRKCNKSIKVVFTLKLKYYL
jgi:hypothetical protein